MKEINAEENSILAKQQEEKRLRDEALKRAQQQPYIIIRDPPKILIGDPPKFNPNDY